MPNSTTMLYAIGAFVLGVIVAIGAERLVFSHKDQRDAMETFGVFQGWRLNCPPRTMKNGTCVMQQALARKGSSAAIAELNIATRDGKDYLTVVAPLGVLVPPGLKVSIGNGTDKMISYKTCVQMGCVATVPIDQAMADAMSNNAGIRITVFAPDERTVPLNFSLGGYKDALAARTVDMAARK